MLRLRHLVSPRFTSLRSPSGPSKLSSPFRTPQRAHYYPFPPRQPTLGARIWFKPDGSPRSKLRGLVITSIISGILIATYNTLLVVEALDYENYLLSTLVYIQRIDYDFSTVSFENFRAALDYFAEMCAYFGQGDNVSPEMVEAFFRDIAGFETDAALRGTVHTIIRDACEAVHVILGKSKGEDAMETAVMVMNIVDKAMMGLIELSEDVNSDETDRMLRGQRLREQMAAKDSSKGYEILG